MYPYRPCPGVADASGQAWEMSAMAEGRSGMVMERRVRETGAEWYMSGDDVMGKSVINPQGEDLGKISDMRIAFPQGRVEYVVLRYGGVLGMGGKHFAVPVEALTYRLGDDVLVVNIAKDTLDNAAGFSENDWPREPDWNLIESARVRAPPSREEAEVVTTERVEVRDQPRQR